MIKIGGRFGGFRTLSTHTCNDIFAELIEIDNDGVQTVLTTYEIIGIKKACQVSKAHLEREFSVPSQSEAIK